MSKETSIDFSENGYRKCIDVQTGVCKIFTEVPNKRTGKTSRHTVIEISPPNKSGICYAEYLPISKGDGPRRIAINKNGEKIFEYKNPEPTYFKQNVKAAKQYYSSLFEK